MNFNSVITKATIAIAVIASASAVSSPAQALDVKGKVNQTLTSVPGSVVGVKSDTVVDALADTAPTLPDPLNVKATDKIKNTLSVGVITNEVLADVNETLNSATEVTAPIVPVKAQAKVEVKDLGVNLPPVAKANANACVGVGVNAGAPGCPKGGNETSIPAPAMLPGLIALGAGMLRKRKAAEQIEA
ncbi:MAG: PTPA-CTERM sorting domain-containing protein [Leptolyngbyaceae cyanobacterium RU_5_1]|nr:PTPA-CTERM sorting domain-containing protein [Leptolyngbyaceae cyanobacterium RU_5_1]